MLAMATLRSYTLSEFFPIDYIYRSASDISGLFQIYIVIAIEFFEEIIIEAVLRRQDLDESTIDGDSKVLPRWVHTGGSKVEVLSRRIQAVAYPVAAAAERRS